MRYINTACGLHPKGDEVVVRVYSIYYTALGTVLQSGNAEINKQGLTLLEALGSVGGLSDERANKTGVFVFRLADPQINPGAVFKLNLMQPVSIFVAQKFGVQPEDVIYMSLMRHFRYATRSGPLLRTVTAAHVLSGPVTTTAF
jgi:polysaccharide biosynthesis/export protein